MKKFYRTGCLVLMACLVLLFLSSCAFNGQGNSAEINMQAAQYLNPDMNGRPSPLVVTLYQLKKPFSFQQASYSALSANSSAVLGGDIVDQKIVEIRPGESKTISLPLAQNTQYIGISAAYRKIDQATWHKVIKIPLETNPTIRLSLESQGLTAKLVPKGSGWFWQ